ncbi:MAG: hypothetical protein K2H60_13025 [Muribaculaceae bacterium]|nr:hypothetical protein [Muribaculaceae bacterium]
MYRKIISMCMALVFLGAYAQNYYEITGDNVNVRRAPVNGEIVGHLNTNNLVASGDPENGWLYVDLPELDIRGYVSEKFITMIR